MNRTFFKKLVRNRWVRVALIVLLALILFAIKYGRQTLTTYLIYTRDEKHGAYLDLTPELRKLIPSNHKKTMVFDAFGYRIDVPLSSPPELLNLDSAKGLIFKHKFTIIVYEPMETPLNMYQYFKTKKDPDDVSHFKLIFENKFKSNFDYVKSAFFAVPTKLAIFKPIEETLLLYYQLVDKRIYSNTGHTLPEKIYYFESDNCMGFQVGDPSRMEKLTLWIFPEPEKQIEIYIQGIDPGVVKQRDIDFIITTFKKLNDDFNRT